MSKNFVVYSSSAGSGKTYTLVQEYLRIALSEKDPSRFRNILAMTFTNKAANEMKQRVIDSLRMLARKPDDDPSRDTALQEYLCTENRITPNELQERARNTLQNILHNYTDLSISTIDKFTHKVIRTFARDLDLPSDFEVHMDTDELLQRTIDALIANAGEDEQLTKVLLDFTYHKTDEDKNWKVETDMFEFSKNLLKEDAEKFLEPLRQLNLRELVTIRNELGEDIAKFEQPLVSMGKEALTLLAEAGIPAEALKGGATRGIGRYFQYLAQNTKHQPTDSHRKYAEDEDWTSGKATTEQRHTIESVRPQLSELFRKACSLVDQKHATYTVQKMIYGQFYALSLLHELEQSIQELKEDQNLLLIADFNKKISEVVRKEPVPFIYERLGERYKNFLLDEFQDTSLLQWQNLVPLVENSLANGNFNLVVGDGKQSIYRWRNGEVEQFISLPNLYQASDAIAQHEASFVRNYLKKPLNKNWRSKREIIEFNNLLFKTLAPAMLNEHFASVYEDVEQECANDEAGGYVHMEFLPEGETNDEAYLSATLSRINEALADGYHYRDIAIICRTTKKGSITANYLLQHNIPVISSDSMLLSSNDEVNLLIALLQHLTNPKDQGARLAVMRYWKPECFKDGALFSFLKNDNGLQVDLQQFLSENNVHLRYAAMREMPNYDLVEELIRLFELEVRNNPYLMFFLDAVHRFATSESKETSDFLRWWEDRKDKLSIKVPEKTDAVEVLTIHKSKGLQYPVVIAPFANWQMSKGNDTLWVTPQGISSDIPAALVSASKALEETEFSEIYETEKAKTNLDHLNMLYVALTRAEDRLYVISDQRTGKDSIRHYLLDAVSHLPNYSDSGTYEYGKRTAPTHKHDAELQIFELDHCPSSQWKKHLKISLRAPSVWNMEDPEGSVQFGNLLHTALANIQLQTDIDWVIKQMQLDGLMDEENAASLKEELNSLFSLERMKDWFGDNVTAFVESEILCSDGSIIRPDRVVVSGKKAEVIDFKTGRKNDQHVKQIEQYANRLADIGYDEVEKFLVYTTEREIVEI